MKVLHVVQGYTPAIGGTEWLIQRISEELACRYGDEVTVFTTNCYNGEGFLKPKLPRMPVGWEQINGVRVRRFPVQSRVSQILRGPQWIAYRMGLPYEQYLRTWAQGPLIPGLKKEIRDFPADLIVASSFPLLHMYSALSGAAESNRPCVLHGAIHPQDGWGFQRPMIYQAIRRANAYIANTQFEADYVVKRGADPETVSTIGVGVDPQPFMQACPEEARRRLGLEGFPVVGFIGQFSMHKGVGTLLESMRAVWQVVPQARLLLAGSRTQYARQVEGIIAAFPEADQQKIKIVYNFSEAEKPWLFNAVDVFAYPSGFESFGIAFIEAWASGKPVIGCQRGAIPWVVDAGRDGLLVEHKNPDLLAEAIILLLQSPGWAQEMGAKGRQKVLSRYTWDVVASRFRQVYQKAIDNYRSASKASLAS